MKSMRHNIILEIIENKDIETQEELASYLKEAGYHVTQATVSRDIRELKLTKVQREGGRQCYSVMQTQKDFSEKYLRILRDCFISMDMAQNILGAIYKLEDETAYSYGGLYYTEAPINDEIAAKLDFKGQAEEFMQTR